MVDLETYFEEYGSGERRMYKAPTDVALDRRLEQFVRETAQNSADEAAGDESPELLYRFTKLEGDNLDDFLDSINWESSFRGHLEAVAEDDDEIGVQKMIDRVDNGTLPVLMVEDYQTSGLTGDEFSEKTRYSTLVQDFGQSTKEADQGGVHGVGASVLWGFSGFKTAIFLTNPVNWSSNNVPRLVGRIDLPYHEHDGKEWHGGGWIGQQGPSGRRAISVKGDAAAESAAADLHIDEEGTRADETGTAIAVVGFREPSVGYRSPAKVIERISELTSRYYWPLLLEEGLDVEVQSPEDASPEEVDPNAHEEINPFIEAYDGWEEADDTLEDAPDIASVEIPVEVPPREGEGDSTEGSVTLVVRTHNNGDDDIHRNHLAMFRGARHVIKYRQYGHIARSVGEEFHGLLLAGKAKYEYQPDDDEISDADQAIEDFFRVAEPKAHDSWEEESSKLQNNFPGGHEEIERLFQDAIPTALRELLTEAGSDDEEMLEDVGRQFPYFSGGPSDGPNRGGGGGGSRTIEGVHPQLSHIGGRYLGEGTLKLTEAPTEEWILGIGIEVVDASHQPIEEVPVDDLEGTIAGSTTPLDPVSSGEPRVRVPAGVEAVEFELTSILTDNIDAVGEGQARLNFTIEVGGQS